jgi:hypothetical protein
MPGPRLVPLVTEQRNPAASAGTFHTVGRDSSRRMSAHAYEVRPRKDHRGVRLISDALPFGALWYGEPNAASNAVGYAKFYSRSAGRACSISLTEDNPKFTDIIATILRVAVTIKNTARQRFDDWPSPALRAHGIAYEYK